MTVCFFGFPEKSELINMMFFCLFLWEWERAE